MILSSFFYVLTPGSQAPVAQGVLEVLQGPPNGALSSLDRVFSVEFWVRSSFILSRRSLVLNFVQEANESTIASNPLTIGATTMLLAFRARSLAEPELRQGKRCPSSPPKGSNAPNTATSASDWCKSAERSVRTLSSHLDRIDNLLSRYIGLQDLGGCISIQGSNIIALVALAEMYHHLSRNPAFPRTEEAQTRFLTAMEQVVAAVEDLRNGNHLQKVHVYTGVCQGCNTIRSDET